MRASVSTIPTPAALWERFREAHAVWSMDRTDAAREAALRAYHRWEAAWLRENKTTLPPPCSRVLR